MNVYSIYHRNVHNLWLSQMFAIYSHNFYNLWLSQMFAIYSNSSYKCSQSMAFMNICNLFTQMFPIYVFHESLQSIHIMFTIYCFHVCNLFTQMFAIYPHECLQFAQYHGQITCKWSKLPFMNVCTLSQPTINIYDSMFILVHGQPWFINIIVIHGHLQPGMIRLNNHKCLKISICRNHHT